MRWNVDLGQFQINLPEGMSEQAFLEGLSIAVETYCQLQGVTIVDEDELEESELTIDEEDIAELVN